MKIDVKKNGETILHREDAKSITDKGGAYEIAYADGEGQVVFKGENVAIELKDQDLEGQNNESDLEKGHIYNFTDCNDSAKKYTMKKRTYICFAWLYWLGDLID